MAPTLQTARNSRAAAAKEYDVIIIGGGIYGITLALEAGRRGLKSLLLEKGDFGEYTSFNSLKIIHGGLRYLQSLDLHRFKESVAERTWFLKHTPKQVHPLPCLMPLYGRGMKRPAVFRMALLANHLLSLDRNKDLDPSHQLPAGSIVDAAETKKIFPLANMQGLQGSALWYDACMPDSQLLVMELLRYACHTGTTAINYCRAQSLLTTSHGTIKGVMAVDRETAENHEFKAPIVINSCGPWSRKMVSGLADDNGSLFIPSLAWNVSFNRPALSTYALAVQGKAPGSRLLFVTPWKGRIFAGCGHEPWLRGPDKPMPTQAQLANFIEEINQAIPGVNLTMGEVHRVFAGLLPAAAEGSNVLTKREVIIDHGAKGGPEGLYSVGGIKFTTARLVAEKIWGMIGKKKPGLLATPSAMPILGDNAFAVGTSLSQQIDWARREDNSIVHLDDLVLRRTTLWEDGDPAALAAASASLGFEADKAAKELKKCTAALQPLALEPQSQQQRKNKLH
ncbi:MAG: FAD-dependent oxidoreductase [Desulforhopalus sp.]|nr:FAD-dependent oxidoreductase [Desulforhopalus sp.]